MIIVIQKTLDASVTINGKIAGKIEHGLVVLVGFEDADTQEDIEWTCRKTVNMRIFEDADRVMNKSLLDEGGDILLISQFTLHASTKKGNRPSYIKAAKPDVAIPLYESTIKKFEEELGKPIETGQFGADMKVSLVNDGPVTIVLDSKNKQ
ncbi:MAG: D-aminoacyl-tRNA deacylase [Reichenbachiella sp.]